MRSSLLSAALAAVLTAAARAQEPAPPPVVQPDPFVPFLVGSSHPEIPRRAATPSELGGVRRRSLAVHQAPRRPGRLQVQDLSDRLVGAVSGGRLLYADAMQVLSRVESALAGARLDERTIHRTVAEVEATLGDTPLRGHGKRALSRSIRELLASALHHLP